MDNFLSVKIADTQAYLKGHEPKFRFINRLSIIPDLPNVPLKIPFLCILHYYVQGLILHERIIVLDYVRVTL